MKPGDVAYYDGMIRIDLSKQESMIALPFHPSNAYTIHELQADPERILREVEEDAKKRFGDKISVDLVSKVQNGKVMADQGIIAGCSGGTYDNLSAAAAILNGKSVGNDYFTISAYPQSVPVYMATTRNKIAEELLEAGVVIKPAFCGPCFGAGDVPSNNGLSIRHTTRNFPNREGSKPGQGQISLVALMDARSIAATAANGGIITAATDIDFEDTHKPYDFDAKIYERRVYNGYAKADDSQELKYGPNIKDWPKMYPMEENMLLELAAVIHDPVTTTDELIPSGETSSYRSNPLKLSEFALSRRVPEYVGISKRIQAMCLRMSVMRWRKLVPMRRTLHSVLASSPIVLVTVLHASRQHLARKCLAVMPTSAMNMRQNAIAATVSTGVSCRSPLHRRHRSTIPLVISCSFPVSARQFSEAKRRLMRRLSQPMA